MSRLRQRCAWGAVGVDSFPMLTNLTDYDRALASFIEAAECCLADGDEVAKAKQPVWRQLRRIAAEFEPKVMREFVAAVSQVQDGTRIAAVREALERGDVDAAVESVPWKALGEPYIKSQLVKHLRDAYEKAGALTARNIPVDDDNFDVLNPRVVETLQTRGNDLLQTLADENKTVLRAQWRRFQQRGIFETIGTGIEAGGSAQDLAKLVKPLIGLTEREAEAVLNYRDNLILDGATGIAKEVENYSAKLLQARAMRIARTETAIAVNRGQHEAWQQYIDRGLFEPNELEREWVAVGDSCDLCLPLDGVRVGFDEPFPDGAEPGEIHPSCRCSTTVSPKE